MFKMTITTMVEGPAGVMAEQMTSWHDMTHENLLALEASYLDWLASLPRTIGAEAPVTRKAK